MIRFSLISLLLFTSTLYAVEKDVFPKRNAPDISEGDKFVYDKQDKEIDLQKADQLRTDSIKTISSMLKAKSVTSARKFELLLRLGELYMEKHDYLRGVELARFEKTWDQWNKDKKGVAPRPDYSESKRNLDFSISIFNSLATAYPKHKRADVVWYALGSAYARNLDKKAEDKFLYVLKNYPKSELVPETILALGEYYFDKHQINEAMSYYKKMGRYKEHPAYPYSIYKLAWSYYNLPSKSNSEQLENNTKSSNAFKFVIRLAKDSKQQNHISLRNEALNDLVIVLADIGDVDAAWDYFSKLGEKDKFYNLLERLGWIYFENGEFAKSSIVYERFLREAPESQSRQKVYGRLFELYDHLDQHQKMHELAKAMWDESVKKLGPPTNLEWQRDLALKTHRYGAIYHNKAEKLKDNKLYATAAIFYNFYLEKFKSYPAAIEVKYNLAELEYKLGNFMRSSDLFTQVVEQSKEAKFQDPSAEGMIDAAVDHVTKSNLAKAQNLGKFDKPIIIPAPKKFLMTKIQIYLKYVPKSKDAASLSYDHAYIQFEYGWYKESIQEFKNIIEKYPQSPQAITATKLLVGFYNEKRQWDTLLSFVDSVRSVKFKEDKEFQSFLLSNAKIALFTKGLDLEKLDKNTEAAISFIKYYTLYASDTNSEKALYNAIQNFIKSNDIVKAQNYSEEFIAKYPKSELRKDLIVKAAANYEQLAEFDKAASLYERYIREYPTDKFAKEALYNAAIMFQSVLDDEKSVSLLDEYMRRYPNAENFEAVLVATNSSLERIGEFRAVLDNYAKLEKMFSKDHEKYLEYFTKKMLFKQEKLQQKPVDSEINYIRSRLAGGVSAYTSRKYVSVFMFNAIERDFERFISTKLGDPDTIEKDVKSMQNRLINLVARYQAVMNIKNSEYIAASLFRIGQLHQSFGTEIQNAPEPIGLGDDQLAQYRISMDAAATPLLEQAKDYYKSALMQAKEIDSFSKWPELIAENAVELDRTMANLTLNMSIDSDYISHRFESERLEAKFAH